MCRRDEPVELSWYGHGDPPLTPQYCRSDIEHFIPPKWQPKFRTQRLLSQNCHWIVPTHPDHVCRMLSYWALIIVILTSISPSFFGYSFFYELFPKISSVIQFSLPQAVPCIRLVSSDDVAPSIEPQKLGSSPLDTPSISDKFYQPQRPQRPQRPQLSSLTHRLWNALTGFDTDERHLLPQLHASNFRDMPRPFNIFSTSFCLQRCRWAVSSTSQLRQPGA